MRRQEEALAQSQNYIKHIHKLPGRKVCRSIPRKSIKSFDSEPSRYLIRKKRVLSISDDSKDSDCGDQTSRNAFKCPKKLYLVVTLI